MSKFREITRLSIQRICILTALLSIGGASIVGSARAESIEYASGSRGHAVAQVGCGFRSVRISQHESSAYWRNCVNHGQRINVDRAFYPDYEVCVGAGQDRYLGSGLVPVGPGAIRGAGVIGRC